MRKLLVLNIVGLTHSHLGRRTPNLSALAEAGFSRPMGTVLPAVTCTAQSTLLTGTLPREHGVVANGWYFRDLAEVMFWRQSNHLVAGEKLFEAAKTRDGAHTTAKMFWWYNMYSAADFSMTPRPSYPADGRKVFDSYSEPPELRTDLQNELGVFPLLKFWGPGAGIESSRWIVDGTLRVLERQDPTLALVYLPHLDYDFQRFGPDDPRCADAVEAIDLEAGRLIEAARDSGREVVVLSEYAITPVSQPVHINRALRNAGFLRVRTEPLGWETLDCGASRAFAVADHQVAHVYVRKATDVAAVKSLLEQTDGIERVLDQAGKSEAGLDHPRSGELIAVAAPQAWFTYYFWLEDQLAPDYARTVDIHRKPGYDPVELLVDPKIRFPKLKLARRLLRKKLGMRYYMDVIGLDATIIKGSHGRLPAQARLETDGPVFLSSATDIERDAIAMTDVKSMLLDLQFN